MCFRLDVDRNIIHQNGINCGQLICGDDGVFLWFAPYPSQGGGFPDYFFKFVYDELRKLNEPVEKDIEEYFRE